MVGDPVVVYTSAGNQVFTIYSYISSSVVTVEGTVTLPTGVTNGTFAIPGFSSLQNIPNISLERITIGYDASDPLKPRLYINGVDTAIRARTLPPREALIWWSRCGTYFTHIYTRSTGDYLAIGLDALAVSDQLLVAARKVVNDANIAEANGGSLQRRPDRRPAESGGNRLFSELRQG